MSRMPYYIYYISNIFFRYRVPLIPTLLVYINRILWGLYVPASCSIGKGTRFGYGGSGVVIHARAVIGKNNVINPGVTIGGKSKEYKVPVIGDNVYIGGGSKILGDVNIGDNVIVGANSVVITDIPSSSIVAGIPSRIIKKDINIKDYL